ncbi:Flavohemoprotein [Methylocella tundrae]|uniref:Flavohemoprotein n=1 Tax=Methylocella tundrae TaxID=227605 RepID=A0A8B6LZA5_METTU|nr:NO-inducible flavohemoprotein [Methylocella tundrae]VTZ26302.1 Flavohemoprotein [Methylocella tundrae]VTZ48117.1 Flavohemoprotein [Methylocella tundrae]
MAAALSAKTIAIVKSTVPALRTHGLDITRRMYERLFQDAPIRALFNQSHQGTAASQPVALANAVLAYAENIENLGALAPAVERIAQKHVALRILPEHYPFVAAALLGAIKDVLGAAATEEVISAWGEAYWFLADVLIGRETVISADLAAAPGGWTGWRDFVVDRVERESDVIKSFYLRPADGRAVLRHRPGQYLTFEADIPGSGLVKRNYSISSAPDDRHYRVTIKREAAPGAPAGLVSNWFHDYVGIGDALKIAPPAGDFALDVADDRPVVLLSGGVGLTPMVSMLETIARDCPDRRAWYVHGALNGAVHAMGSHVKSLAKSFGGAVTTFYAEPATTDVRGVHFDEHGMINVDWLKTNTPIAEAVYYLCGPRPFLRSLVRELYALGLPADRVRYEFFGPAEELLTA